MSRIEQSGRPPDGGEVRRIIMEEAQHAMDRALIKVEGTWRARLVPGVRGYQTGTYSRSITHESHRVGEDQIAGSVGTNLFYAKYLEYGTGLYGPLNHWIVPQPLGRTARNNPGRPGALRFPAGGAGFTLSGRRRSGRAGAMAQYVYRKRVRGIKPRHYARDAAMIARPSVEEIFRQGGQIAAARIGGVL